MYGVGPDHAGAAGYAGPEALPSAVKLSVYSGQPTSLPLSGLALGPSGGSVAGRPYDSLVFFGLTDDIFGASSLNGALVNNYDVPTGVSFPGSPAVAPWGVVFIVASDFSLLALDFQVGGSPLWRYSPVVTSRLSYTVTPPTVHGVNRAVFYSAASVGIVAVDADTGARLWSFSPGVDPATSLPYACSTSPALDPAGARIFFGCDDYGVYGLNASTGGQLWVRPCANVVQASPAVSEDGALVFISSDANNLLALDAVTGLDAWLGVNVANAAVSAAPVIAAGVGVLAVTRDGTLFAANGSAPLSVVWQTQLRDTANGSSVVVGAALTLGSNGTVFVACEGGQLFGVRVADGAVQWMLNLGEPLYAPPILTPTNLLLLPSLTTSALFVVRGLSATATPSATASATASSAATSTSSGSATASASASATLTAFFTASGTPSNSPSATASANASSAADSGGGASNAAGLDATSTIVISAVVPLAIVVCLAAAAVASGRLRVVVGKGAAAEATEWRLSSSAAQPLQQRQQQQQQQQQRAAAAPNFGR
jgi:outer membrane protein assembly factor BamB